MKSLFSTALTFLGASALNTTEYSEAALEHMEALELSNQIYVPCQWWYNNAWYDFSDFTTLPPMTYVAQSSTDANKQIFYALCVPLNGTENGKTNTAAFNSQPAN